jgi:hypothetical protein
LTVKLGTLRSLIILAIATAAITACGGGAQTWEGREIAGLDKTVDQADATFFGFVGTHADTQSAIEDSRCYLIRDPAGNMQDYVKCGPVGTTGGNTVFDIYELAPTYEGDDTVSFSVIPSPSGTTVGFAATEGPFRPDGKKVPESYDISYPTTTTTTIPDAPPLEAGFGGTLQAEPGLSFNTVGTVVPLPGDGSLAIDEVGEVSRIGHGRDALIAPEGGSLLIWRATFKPSSWASMKATYLINGAVFDLQLFKGQNLYVLALGDKTADVSIRIQLPQGVAEIVDLRDGHWIKGPIDVLLRGEPTIPLDANIRQDLVTTTLPCNFKTSYVAFTSAAANELYDPNLGYAGDGMAWVVVFYDLDTNGPSYVSCASSYVRTNWRALLDYWLTSPDGDVYEANTDETGALAFQVPDTSTELTLHAVPAIRAWNSDFNQNKTERVDVAGSEVTIPVVFPSGG